MKIRFNSLIIIQTSLFIAFPFFVLADTNVKVETLSGASAPMLANNCAGCHGSFGASRGPSIPILSGLSAAYLVNMMGGFKSDVIPSTIMGRIAKGYSSEEIEKLAQYFADQKFVAAKGQASDPIKARKGADLHKKYCEKCHTENGAVGGDDSGYLQGQWKPYLAAQFKSFIKGQRKAPRKMKKRIKRLLRKEGAAGVEALLEFYSQ
ncbi:MAG: c-type cytochrome [Cocleimonas sp.]